MDYSYPLLHKVFDHFKSNRGSVDEIYLVCCQHLLEPQLKMFELFIEFGFNPEKIVVLGKAYSTNKDILNELIQTGVKVLQPKFTGMSFDIEHANNCKTVLELVPKDVQTIVLDDGAELIKTFIEAGRSVSFAVEQTSSGFRRLENIELDFPVVNVARSEIKLTQESSVIAHHAFERITSNLSTPLSVLVVGLGAIGEAVLEIFKQNNFITNGFDVAHGHNDLLSFILENKPGLIVGATGSNIISKDDIERLVSSTPLYLISVSSSDREFPVVSFRTGNDVHQDVSYKNVTFMNNGFPITFKGNRFEILPPEIEKTICLLGGAIIDGVANGFKTTGLVDVSENIESLVDQTY